MSEMQSEMLAPMLLMFAFIILAFINSLSKLIRTLSLIGALIVCVYGLSKLWCLSDGWLVGTSICELMDNVSTANLAQSISGAVPTIVSIIVLVGVISAMANIVVGFRNQDNGLVIAGAICGLIALSSAPAVSEPTIFAVVTEVLAALVGVDGFIHRGARYL